METYINIMQMQLDMIKQSNKHMLFFTFIVASIFPEADNILTLSQENYN